MTIKVLEKTPGCLPVILEKGDWIDLTTAEETVLKAPQANKMHVRNHRNKEVAEVRTRDVDFDSTLIPLGVCMQLPAGFEAIVAPRSSSFKKYGILQTNSIGVIDGSYCGDEDEWKFPALATRKITIPKGTRIAQFRIQPSQKATLWQKLKWLLSSSITLKVVESLDNPNRTGFGSTGN